MIPPTSIDGTDITGATIDGTDVTEITVDGQTVFSAATLPVAFSDMIAWYPMEANIPGGDEYSDATALFSGAADSTAYNLIDDGAFFEPGEGVTDIQQGANSDAFENNGGANYLTSNVPVSLPITITLWYNGSTNFPIGSHQEPDSFFYGRDTSNWFFDNDPNIQVGSVLTNVWTFIALSIDVSGNALAVQNRSSTNTGSVSAIGGQVEILNIGDGRSGGGAFDGYVDDVRFYNTDLSLPEIQQIYDNTKP